VVIPQQQDFHAELCLQILLHELRRSQMTEVRGKRNYVAMVHTQLAQNLLFLLQRGKQTETAGILLQNRAGVGPERHDGTLTPPAFSKVTELSKDGSVTQVYSIKESGSCYNHFTNSKS
jgi:hypothetical protein